jgi:bacterioferritin (cytochrome b1)
VPYRSDVIQRVFKNLGVLDPVDVPPESVQLERAGYAQLRGVFDAGVPPARAEHAGLVADKIAVLGGTPTTTPRPVPRAIGASQILRNILEVEQRAIADYTERSIEAAAFGEIVLKVELENLIVDETRHRDEVERILAGWTHTGIDSRA